jgi:hypothetical protein
MKSFFHEGACASLDFRAIDAIETLTGEADDTIPSASLWGRRLGIIGKVLWGLMRKHHPDSTLDEAAGLMFSTRGVNASRGWR